MPDTRPQTDPYSGVGAAIASYTPAAEGPFEAVGQATGAQVPSGMGRTAAQPPQDPFAAVGAATANAIPPGTQMVSGTLPDISPSGIEFPVPPTELYAGKLPQAPTYDQAMDALKGPVPTPDRLVMDWKDPQHMAAVQGFRSAIEANFLQATAEGAQSMSQFFGMNPYAYMLGLAQDEMANAVQNIAIKNGMDDPYANQFITAENIFNMAQLVAGTLREQAGGQFGGNEEFLKKTFLPYLSKLPARVVKELGSMGTSMAMGAPEFMNAMANTSNANSNRINAMTNQRAQTFAEQQWNEVGRRAAESGISLQGAQREHLMAQATNLMKETGYMGTEKEAQIAYTLSLAAVNNATASLAPVKAAHEAMSTEMQQYHSQLAVLNNVADTAYKEYADARAQLALDMQNSKYPLTEEEAAAGVQPGRGQAALAAYKNLEALQARWRDAQTRSNEYSRTVYDRVGSGVAPEFNALTPAPWLAAGVDRYLQYESQAPGTGLRGLMEAAGTNRFLRDQLFPSQIKKWNGKQFEFIENANPVQLINPPDVAKLYTEILRNMPAIRAWRPGMPPPVPGPQEFAKQSGLPVAKWYHFIHMVNYMKQLDYQMSQYAQMKAAGMNPSQATMSAGGAVSTAPNALPTTVGEFQKATTGKPKGKK